MEEDEAPRRAWPWVGVAILIAIAAALGTLLPGHVARARARAEREGCAAELKRLGVAAIQYSETKRLGPWAGRFTRHPPRRTFPYAGGDWNATIALLERAKLLAGHPSCPTARAIGGAAYEGFQAPWSHEPRDWPHHPEDIVLAWDADPHPDHEGSFGRNVLFGDGSVRFVSEEAFRALRAEHDAATEDPDGAASASHPGDDKPY